jgi:hypothetical protein
MSSNFHCFHCGWVVGSDALRGGVICPDCERAGHSGYPFECPVCTDRNPDLLTPEERRKRLRVRAALAESKRDMRWDAAMANPERWMVSIHPAIGADGNFTLEDDLHEHDC